MKAEFVWVLVRTETLLVYEVGRTQRSRKVPMYYVPTQHSDGAENARACHV